MNSIGEIVKEWPGQAKKGVSVDQKLSLLLKHPALRRFVNEHSEITREEYRRSLSLLDQFVMDAENCQRCKSISACPNLIRGHASTLSKYADYLDLRLVPCSKHNREQEQKRRKRLIRSHHIPKDILAASFQSIVADDDRCMAIDAAIDFCSRFRTKKQPTTGLYLYGPLGAGKSRIAGAMVNDLVRYNVDSYMFYVPEFMREVSESIHDHSLHSKLEELKNVSVLIFDDIGAEFLTPWKRDEILGAILQYRVSEQLPTVFTSNLDLDELEAHLSNTSRDADDMKAKRVMERIRYYTKAYHVGGKNWREDRKN